MKITCIRFFLSCTDKDSLKKYSKMHKEQIHMSQKTELFVVYLLMPTNCLRCTFLVSGVSFSFISTVLGTTPWPEKNMAG